MFANYDKTRDTDACGAYAKFHMASTAACYRSHLITESLNDVIVLVMDSRRN